jgi:hypothetical protein
MKTSEVKIYDLGALKLVPTNSDEDKVVGADDVIFYRNPSAENPNTMYKATVGTAADLVQNPEYKKAGLNDSFYQVKMGNRVAVITYQHTLFKGKTTLIENERVTVIDKNGEVEDEPPGKSTKTVSLETSGISCIILIRNGDRLEDDLIPEGFAGMTEREATMTAYIWSGPKFSVIAERQYNAPVELDGKVLAADDPRRKEVLNTFLTEKAGKTRVGGEEPLSWDD